MALPKGKPARAKELEDQSTLAALGASHQSEAAVRALEASHIYERRLLAHGRCECAGECGFSHGWLATSPTRRCGAVHGSEIVRKLDNPSFWQLAPSGTSGELAFPEPYRLVAIPVTLDTVRFPGTDRVIVACQRCRTLIERGQAEDTA